jgi:hypothetical protein
MLPPISPFLNQREMANPNHSSNSRSRTSPDSLGLPRILFALRNYDITTSANRDRFGFHLWCLIGCGRPDSIRAWNICAIGLIGGVKACSLVSITHHLGDFSELVREEANFESLPF